MNTKTFNRTMAGIQRSVELGILTLNPQEKSATIQAEMLDGKSDDYKKNAAKNIATYIFPLVHKGKSLDELKNQVQELSLYNHNKQLVATVKGNEVNLLG